MAKNRLCTTLARLKADHNVIGAYWRIESSLDQSALPPEWISPYFSKYDDEGAIFAFPNGRLTKVRWSDYVHHDPRKPGNIRADSISHRDFNMFWEPLDFESMVTPGDIIPLPDMVKPEMLTDKKAVRVNPPLDHTVLRITRNESTLDRVLTPSKHSLKEIMDYLYESHEAVFPNKPRSSESQTTGTEESEADHWKRRFEEETETLRSLREVNEQLTRKVQELQESLDQWHSTHSKLNAEHEELKVNYDIQKMHLSQSLDRVEHAETRLDRLISIFDRVAPRK